MIVPKPLLALESVSQHYPNPGGRGKFRALDNVTLSLAKGESLGLAGESGAGKSTLTRLVLGLEAPTQGRVLLKGRNLANLDRHQRKTIKRQVQIIWQDPLIYLNPYYSVRQLIAEPMEVHGLAGGEILKRKIHGLIELVDLPLACLGAYPHELSGGQCQRVAIARALSVKPELLICDEALASLDLAQQVRMVKLLFRLHEQAGMSYLFISHDLAPIGKLCARIAVFKDGRLLEQGSTSDVLAQPTHPYTKALVQASLVLPHVGA